MNTIGFTEFAARWDVTLPEVASWTDLLPLIEKVCKAKQGYFVFKVDGERSTRKYTFVLNFPFPADFVWRKDTDSIEEGLTAIVEAFCASGIRP